jgi:hypothetical protein
LSGNVNFENSQSVKSLSRQVDLLCIENPTSAGVCIKLVQDVLNRYRTEMRANLWLIVANTSFMRLRGFGTSLALMMATEQG